MWLDSASKEPLCKVNKNVDAGDLAGGQVRIENCKTTARLVGERG
jgi:hypothetical protein